MQRVETIVSVDFDVCLPKCLHWGTSDAQICVDCNSPELQPLMSVSFARFAGLMVSVN